MNTIRIAGVAFLLVALMLSVPDSVLAAPQYSPFHGFSALSTSVPATNSDGATPSAFVADSAGNLYGTTSSGGANGTGTIFKYTGGTQFSTLYTFSALSASTNSDGAAPDGGLVEGLDGDFYGTTNSGGASGTGTVYKITPAGALTTLHSFASAPYPSSANSDGAHPLAGLVVGSDGNLYGTAQGGGASGVGTVFKITPSGTFTTLASFDGSNGSFPYAALVVGLDGNYYGTTFFGGPSASGNVFEVTPSGTLTNLYAFPGLTSNNDTFGGNPQAALVVGQDGSFYGTTTSGGLGGGGTVFKLMPDGTLTTLYAFASLSTAGTNVGGEVPSGGLVVSPSGDLYGTTEYGGTDGKGTVFRLTPGGILTTLINFNGLNGAHPTTSLALSQDAALYGTTSNGGVNGTGSLFNVTIQPETDDLSWFAAAAGAGTSSTGTVLWTRDDGAAGVWTLGANDAETAIGPTYGPFSEWSAQAVATAADGTSRVLWTKTTGEAGVWSLDATGKETAIGPTYGPFPGWLAQSIGVAADGTARVLWTNASDQAGIWSFGANDTETLTGPTYGPYAGWTAMSLATATNGTSRVLWDNTNGQAGVWSFNTSDAMSVIGPTYGPVSGWTANAIGVAGDGTSRVLWTNANGDAGIWSFNASDMETVIGAVQGPYSGWTAGGLATASDGTSRVLWDNATRAAGVWSFGANDAESVIGQVYGPF